MSDFFGDDFTAELKGFFLNQLQTELTKYLQSVDEASLLIFCQELQEKSPEWIVDARTNEFVHFANWFDECVRNLCQEPDLSYFKQCLKHCDDYLTQLLVSKKDTPELAQAQSVSLVRNSVKDYLQFQMEGKFYALPAQYVVEIVGQQRVSRLPQPTPRIGGMIAYRGDAIPVFDLSAQTSTDFFFCVICILDKNLFALRVDKVETLVSLANQDLQSTEAVELLVTDPYISHFVLHEGKNVMVFDLPRLVAA